MGWILLGVACAEPEKFYRHELGDAGGGGKSGAAGVFGTAGVSPLPTTGAAGTGTGSGQAGAGGTTTTGSAGSTVTAGAAGTSATGAAGSFVTGGAGATGASGASGGAGRGAAGATAGTGGLPVTDAGSDAPPPPLSDAGGSCMGVPVYMSGSTYQADDRVVSAGSLYQCRPWPNSGWCSMAASYYGPGIGSAWMDAWLLVGRCN
jgi:hypothetical protein